MTNRRTARSPMAQKSVGRRSLPPAPSDCSFQAAFPDAAAWKEQSDRIRMVAYPHLLQINTGFTGDFSLLLSNNHSTGGTCFGDSGGPNVVGGVTSYGLNATCGGTGGIYRVDRADDLNWLYSQFGRLLR